MLPLEIKYFLSLPFDLKDKICFDVGIIKETQKNKRYFSDYVLGELKYYKGDNSRLNDIYYYYDIGLRMDDYDNCLFTNKDELYYENLDYLLMCNKQVIIDINRNKIQFDYILKDIYKQQGKSYREIDATQDEDEDNFGFSYNCNGIITDLKDVCYEIMDNNYYDDEDNSNELDRQDIMDILYNTNLNITNNAKKIIENRLKTNLIKLSRGKIW